MEISTFMKIADKYLSSTLLFDENKLKMARRPGKKQKENPVGDTGEGKR